MKYLLLFILFVLCACEHSEPPGCCPLPPNISRDTLSFNAQGGTDSIIANDSFCSGSKDPFWGERCKLYSSRDSGYCTNNYCSENAAIMKIECLWFEVQRTNADMIMVSVNPNETNQKRATAITMYSGDCGTRLFITQSAE